MTQRRWFQFHLSTVVVLTVVAGIFLGINVMVMDIDEHEGWKFEDRYLLFPKYSDSPTSDCIMPDFNRRKARLQRLAIPKLWS
jgi:hypothetical protein